MALILQLADLECFRGVKLFTEKKLVRVSRCIGDVFLEDKRVGVDFHGL